MLGISGIKPFECVGTNEEMILAMHMFYQKLSTKELNTEKGEFPIIELFKTHILPKMSPSDFLALEKKLMRIYDEDNIPPEIKKAIP